MNRASVCACACACVCNVANIGQLGIYWYWKYVSTILDLIRSKMVRSNMNSRIAATETVATAAAAAAVAVAATAAAAPHSLLTLYRTLNIQALTHHIYTPVPVGFSAAGNSALLCQFRSYVKRLSSSHHWKTTVGHDHIKKVSLSLNRCSRSSFVVAVVVVAIVVAAVCPIHSMWFGILWTLRYDGCFCSESRVSPLTLNWTLTHSLSQRIVQHTRVCVCTTIQYWCCCQFAATSAGL